MEAQFCLAAPQSNSTAQRTVHVQSVPLPSSGLRPPGHLAVAGRHPEVPLRPWHRQVRCSTPALPNRSLSPHKMPSFTPGHLEPPLRLSLRLHGGSATSGCLRRPACGLDGWARTAREARGFRLPGGRSDRLVVGFPCQVPKSTSSATSDQHRFSRPAGLSFPQYPM